MTEPEAAKASTTALPPIGGFASSSSASRQEHTDPLPQASSGSGQSTLESNTVQSAESSSSIASGNATVDASSSGVQILGQFPPSGTQASETGNAAVETETKVSGAPISGQLPLLDGTDLLSGKIAANISATQSTGQSTDAGKASVSTNASNTATSGQLPPLVKTSGASGNEAVDTSLSGTVSTAVDAPVSGTVTSLQLPPLAETNSDSGNTAVDTNLSGAAVNTTISSSVASGQLPPLVGTNDDSRNDSRNTPMDTNVSTSTTSGQLPPLVGTNGDSNAVASTALSDAQQREIDKSGDTPSSLSALDGAGAAIAPQASESTSSAHTPLSTQIVNLDGSNDGSGSLTANQNVPSATTADAGNTDVATTIGSTSSQKSVDPRSSIGAGPINDNATQKAMSTSAGTNTTKFGSESGSIATDLDAKSIPSATSIAGAQDKERIYEGEKQAKAKKVIEVIEIADDEFEPPELFKAPSEVVLARKDIEIAGVPHAVDLFLVDELTLIRARTETVNIENLRARCFIDVALEFKSVKDDDDAIFMDIGPYSVTIYKAGAIELLGRFNKDETKKEVIEWIRKCAGRCGNHNLLEKDVRMKLERVTSTALLQRKLIMTKLFARLKSDDSPYATTMKPGILDLSGTVDGHRIKMKITSVGKITIQSPNRVIAKACFEQILNMIQSCSAVQIVASDQRRPSRTDDNSSRKAIKLAATDSPATTSSVTSDPVGAVNSSKLVDKLSENVLASDGPTSHDSSISKEDTKIALDSKVNVPGEEDTKVALDSKVNVPDTKMTAADESDSSSSDDEELEEAE